MATVASFPRARRATSSGTMLTIRNTGVDDRQHDVVLDQLFRRSPSRFAASRGNRSDPLAPSLGAVP
jgi:hypothetical protein